jgi:cobalamin biosynthesis Mg chelatase CobN
MDLTRDSDDEPLTSSGSKKGRSKTEGRKKRKRSKVGSEVSSNSNSSSSSSSSGSSSSSSGSSSSGTTSRGEGEEKGDKEEGLDPAGFLQAVAPNFGLDFLNNFNKTIQAMDRLRSWVRGFAQSHQALDQYRSKVEREREAVRFQQAESDRDSERLVRERDEVEQSKKQLEEEKAKYNVASLISVLLDKESKIRELELKIIKCTCNVNCKPGQEPRRDDSKDPGATPVST